MTVPLGLLPVDGQVNLHARVLFPLVDDLLIVHQILHTAGAVDDVDLAVAVAVVAAVVDDGAQRRKADAAGDEEHILAHELGIHGEGMAVGPPDGDLLPHLHAVEPLGHTAALLDGELHVLLIGGGGGDGEHGLAHAGDGQHGALAGLVLEGLLAVGGDHPESFHVGRVDANIGHNADCRHERFAVIHSVCLLPAFSSL